MEQREVKEKPEKQVSHHLRSVAARGTASCTQGFFSAPSKQTAAAANRAAALVAYNSMSPAGRALNAMSLCSSAEVERAMMDDFMLSPFILPPSTQRWWGCFASVKHLWRENWKNPKPGLGLEWVFKKRRESEQVSERERERLRDRERERELLELNFETAVRQSGAAKMFGWIWWVESEKGAKNSGVQKCTLNTLDTTDSSRLPVLPILLPLLSHSAPTTIAKKESSCSVATADKQTVFLILCSRTWPSSCCSRFSSSFFFFYQLRVWLWPSSGATSPRRLKPWKIDEQSECAAI